MHRSKCQSVALITLFGFGIGVSLAANAGYFDDLIGEASNGVIGGASVMVKDAASDAVQDNLKKTEDDSPGNEPAAKHEEMAVPAGSSSASAHVELSIQGITTGMTDTEIRDHLAPVNENSANLAYREFPNAPMANKVSPSCQNEMIAHNKNMMAFQAAGKVQQVTNLDGWVSNGDSLVKKYCPNTLPLFQKYLMGAFGKKLNVNVPPGGRTVTIVLEEPGVLYKAQRLAHLDKERKINAAPKAEMGASDFWADATDQAAKSRINILTWVIGFKAL